jgi:hypothetical protein
VEKLTFVSVAIILLLLLLFFDRMIYFIFLLVSLQTYCVYPCHEDEVIKSKNSGLYTTGLAEIIRGRRYLYIYIYIRIYLTKKSDLLIEFEIVDR